LNSNIRRVLIILLILVWSLMAGGCSASSYTEDMAVPASQSIAGMSVREYDGEQGYSDGDEITLGSKLVYNLDYTLLVPDPSKAVNAIIEHTNKLSGYMVESRLSANNGESSNARLVVKIPQDKMEQMSAYLESLGTVSHQSIYTDDVTTEYYDTEARLKVLQKEEERMLSFMDDKSATIQDLLAIEREIAQVREKRESLQARLNVLKNQVNYSQFNIGLQTSVNELSTPQGTVSKAKNALINSLNSMMQLFNWLVIAFFVVLPYLVLVVLGYLLFRTIKKRRSSSKE
jgi:glycine cleavage system regulatory protein